MPGAPEKFGSVDSNTAIADKILAGPYTKEDEAALWAQLAKLAETTKPATAESILESKYYRVIFGRNGATEQGPRILNLVRWFAIAGFILAVIIGAYVQVTSDGLVSLELDLAERANIIEGNYPPTRLRALMSDDAATATGNDQNPPAAGKGTAAPAAAGAATATDSGAAGASTGPNANADADADPGSDEDAVDDAASNPTETDRQSGLLLAKRSLETEIRGGFSLLGLAVLFAGPAVEMEDGSQAVITGADGNTYVIYNHATLGAQRSINATLGDFVLPMLASFLGVAVFIIRDTSMRLESVSLSPMDDDAYLPRIILGLIAGLTIGWLTPSVAPLVVSFSNGVAETSTTNADGSIAASLSKTALAFVVGYSVEVLFNVLDAIKSALGVQSDKTGQ